MKILIISSFFPYPLDSGGAIRIYHLIKYLSIKHNITLLCYIDEDQDLLLKKLEKHCQIVTVKLPSIRRKWFYHLKHLFCRLPYSLVFIDNQFKQKIIDMSKQDYDLVQFEFIPFAHYIDIFPKNIEKVVERGRERCASQFTWEACVEGYLNISGLSLNLLGEDNDV
ncbi:hypothetical protein ACFLZT_03525 [Thermodesulfobacteriota bacterium]